jgi:DNA replication protein DnaC
MTEPEPTPTAGDAVLDVLNGSLANMPVDVRARARSRRGSGERERARERTPERDRETPEQAAERRERARAHRRAQWEARCPAMYASASVDELTEHQHPGELRRWLDAGHRHLVLHSGRSSTGKTHAAYALGHAAVSAGQWALAWTLADLLADLRPHGLSETDDVARCDLLILDDVGREHDSTGWPQEQLHRLLDVRGREHRRTIVTTNLTGEQMYDRYGEPVVDRLSHDMVVLKFTGPSLRRPAPW